MLIACDGLRRRESVRRIFNFRFRDHFRLGQWYLTYKKTHSPRTILQAFASGPGGVLELWVFSEKRVFHVGCPDKRAPHDNID